jgi:hypothetical protein
LNRESRLARTSVLAGKVRKLEQVHGLGTEREATDCIDAGARRHGSL